MKKPDLITTALYLLLALTIFCGCNFFNRASSKEVGGSVDADVTSPSPTNISDDVELIVENGENLEIIIDTAPTAGSIRFWLTDKSGNVLYDQTAASAFADTVTVPYSGTYKFHCTRFAGFTGHFKYKYEIR